MVSHNVLTQKVNMLSPNAHTHTQTHWNKYNQNYMIKLKMNKRYFLCSIRHKMTKQKS